MGYADIINIKLNNGDRFVFQNKVYKVMQKKDYSYLNPQMGLGLARYCRDVILRQAVITIIDGEAVPIYTDTPFRAVVQALKYSELMLHPENERSWDWLKIIPYTLQGNLEYNCIQDYV